MVAIFGLGKWFSKKKQKHTTEEEEAKKRPEQDGIEQPIPSTIEECEKYFRGIFQDSSDIVVQIIKTSKERAMIIYVDGLANKDLIDRDIIAPLKSCEFNGDPACALNTYYIEFPDIPPVIQKILQGNTAVFYGSSKKAYVVDFKQWDKRSIETPDSETVVRGPKEGFTESIRTNTALLRRKIRTPKLVIECMTIGRQTNTTVELAYLEGIVNQSVLKELKYRLSKIDTDAIL